MPSRNSIVENKAKVAAQDRSCQCELGVTCKAKSATVEASRDRGTGCRRNSARENSGIKQNEALRHRSHARWYYSINPCAQLPNSVIRIDWAATAGCVASNKWLPMRSLTESVVVSLVLEVRSNNDLTLPRSLCPAECCQP